MTPKEANDSSPERASPLIVDIQDLGKLHPALRADDWRGPLVRRLLGSSSYSDGERILSYSYGAPGQHEIDGTMLLRWQDLEADFARCINTYQDPVITEFAGLGLACVLVAHIAKLEITEVTLRGGGGDYWIGKRELLLEVSGQQQGDIKSLLHRKATQLRESPNFGDGGGYVCVADFSKLFAYLSFLGFGDEYAV